MAKRTRKGMFREFKMRKQEELGRSYNKHHKLVVRDRRLIYPLQTLGYIYKYYDKLSPNSYEDAMFDEGKMRYRVRYSLSQRGRLLVQKYYRKLEGDEQISVPT